VQLLTIELLDLAVDNCSLPLHTQVASKEFTTAASQLVRNRETNLLAKEKLLGLIQKWAFKFEHSQDVLPGFSELYDSLKTAGVQFPVESAGRRYISDEDRYREEEPEQRPYRGAEPQVRQSVSSGVSLGARRSLPSAKREKLRKDLGVVQENIDFTNEIIDTSDPREDATTNDVLCQLVATLRAMEGKLARLIASVDDDELQGIASDIKDDAEFTLRRFDDLRRGRRPEANRYKQAVAKSSPVKERKEDKRPVPEFMAVETEDPAVLAVDLVTGPPVEEPFDPFADIPAVKPQATSFASQLTSMQSGFPVSIPPPAVTTKGPFLQSVQPIPTQPYQAPPQVFSSLPQAYQYDPMAAMFGPSMSAYSPSPFTTLTPQAYQTQPPQSYTPQQLQSFSTQQPQSLTTQQSPAAGVKVKHNMGYVQEETRVVETEKKKSKEEFQDLFSLEKL
jgi:hypothetical protein